MLGNCKKKTYKDKCGDIKEANLTIKVCETTSAIGLVNKLRDIILKFMRHEAVILNQFSQLKYLRNAMTENEVLVQVDFSENYCLKYSTEIQSFHFGGSRTQISLHTTSVSYKEDKYGPLKTKSFCTFSENLNHGPSAIMAHLMPVFKFLSESKPSLKAIHFLSDSPSNQYRNKLLFYVFSHLIKEHFPKLLYSTWNYHESGHGKGKPDGIGGTIKRTADRLVAEGKDVDSLDVLVTSLKENVRKVEINVVTNTDIEIIKRKINYADVIPFKGTMKVHQVIQIHDVWGRTVLGMKSMSCFKCIDNKHYQSQSVCNHFSIGTIQYPDHRIVEASVSEKNNTVEKERTVTEKTKVLPDGTVENLGKERKNLNDTIVYWKDIKPGKFVLVKFEAAGSNKIYKYVCSVQNKDEDDGEVVIQGLRLKNDKGNEFVVQDEKDISSVPFSDILQVLEEPKIVLKNRLLIYKFSRPVDVFEKP